MNVECPFAETEILDEHVSRELLKSEQEWDEWMQEICALLDAQSPQLERTPTPTFEKQLVTCLQDD
jgi:hypothetical protein